MTDRTGVRVEGLAELQRTMRAFGDDVRDGWSDTNSRVASFVGAKAAQRAPRRTGMLAASWRPGSGKTNATVKFGGASVPYANPQHWGTGPRPGQRGPHNIRASLFATGAAHDTEPTWFSWYAEALDRMLSRVKGA